MAQSQHIIKQEKRLSWQKYVGQLNPRTTLKKVWDIVEKIKGSGTNQGIKHLKINNTLITDDQDIANALVKHFAETSSTNHYQPEFLNYSNMIEKTQLNFNSFNQETYNMLFSVSELKDYK